MSTPVAFCRRLWSVGVFSGIYLVIAGLLGPTIVVIFKIGIADPTTRGWPLASGMFVVALIAALSFSVAFAIGVFTPSRRARYRRNRLLALASVSALIALAAPLLAMLGLMLISPFIHGLVPPPWVQQCLCLLYIAAMGVALGRLTNGCS